MQINSGSLGLSMLKEVIVQRHRGWHLCPHRAVAKGFLSVRICTFIIPCVATLTLSAATPQADPPPTGFESTASRYLDSGPAPKIWEHEVGEGFSITAQSFGVNAGATIGLAKFGSEQAHDLALISLSYTHMISTVWGEDKWYRGNLEFRMELFTGSQFSPSADWLVGLTPHLRYNFATGTRWIPFVDVGLGVTATQIGPPDLSGTFEFNLQGGAGVQYFLKANLALTTEVHYTHWSCAGMSEPNNGLNGITVLFGLACFF
jgi:lipid A 3-O-deacylase